MFFHRGQAKERSLYNSKRLHQPGGYTFVSAQETFPCLAHIYMSLTTRMIIVAVYIRHVAVNWLHNVIYSQKMKRDDARAINNSQGKLMMGKTSEAECSLHLVLFQYSTAIAILWKCPEHASVICLYLFLSC